MSTLSCDFETRSTVDLPKTGVYPYARHKDTDIWCMAYAFDDEDVQVWVPSEPLPQRIKDHIENGGELRAWNAAFERQIWNEIMVPRYGAPRPDMDQWYCTMADAAAMGLPRALGQAALAMGLTIEKDEEGKRLMLRMSKPRRMEGKYAIWWDDPDKLARLIAYCKVDVDVERAAAKALRRLPPDEREMYLLTERMNDRGIRTDLPLARAAQKIVDEGVQRAAITLTRVTDGAVEAVTKTGDLKRWLGEQGIEVDSVAKAPVAELLADPNLPLKVRAALTARAEAGKSSTAKLRSILTATSPHDGRAHGLLNYHAASTGRWGGALIQPQNFPRGNVPDVESFIDAVMHNDYDGIDLFYHPVEVVSSMLRSMLLAEDGKLLMAGDYSAIEARVVNWLAGQEDILDLFRNGVDVYVHNASILYGITMDDVQKFPHRQTGKFQELGCGFGMGWEKAMSAAKTVYGLDLDEATARRVVEGYRETHAKVKQLWYDANDAALAAVATPFVKVSFGAEGRQSDFMRAGGYLWLKLPSGRLLSYAQPRIESSLTKYGREVQTVMVSAVNGVTRKWERRSLYGGLIVENITQAVARDIMAQAMLRAEASGYEPVLSVHDEIVVETPTPDAAAFSELMSVVPDWAEGLPIDVETWVGERYRK